MQVAAAAGLACVTVLQSVVAITQMAYGREQETAVVKISSSLVLHVKRLVSKRLPAMPYPYPIRAAHVEPVWRSRQCIPNLNLERPVPPI